MGKLIREHEWVVHDGIKYCIHCGQNADKIFIYACIEREAPVVVALNKEK